VGEVAPAWVVPAVVLAVAVPVAFVVPVFVAFVALASIAVTTCPFAGVVVDGNTAVGWFAVVVVEIAAAVGKEVALVTDVGVGVTAGVIAAVVIAAWVVVVANQEKQVVRLSTSHIQLQVEDFQMCTCCNSKELMEEQLQIHQVLQGLARQR